MIRLKKPPRKLQLHLRRKTPVKFLNIFVADVVSLRGLVNASDTAEISRDKRPAEKERVIRILRQIVMADAEVSGIVKAAFSGE